MSTPNNTETVEQPQLHLLDDEIHTQSAGESPQGTAPSANETGTPKGPAGQVPEQSVTSTNPTSLTKAAIETVLENDAAVMARSLPKANDPAQPVESRTRAQIPPGSLAGLTDEEQRVVLQQIKKRAKRLSLEVTREVSVCGPIKNIQGGEVPNWDFENVLSETIQHLRRDPDNQDACAYADELADGLSTGDSEKSPAANAEEPEAPSDPSMPTPKIVDEDTESSICEVDITELKTAKPFCDLLPINDEVKARMVGDMQVNGFDPSHPIVVWKELEIVIDGHTRLGAALECGLKTVLVVYKSFADEDAAVTYALHVQRDRRNLADSDILHLVEKFNHLHPKGGDRRSKDARSKTEISVFGSSAEKTAELVGTSKDKVEYARAVIKHGDDALKASVASGDTPLYRAAKAARKKKAAKNSDNALPAEVQAFTEAIKHIDAAEEALRPVSPKDAELAVGLRDVLRKNAQKYAQAYAPDPSDIVV